MTTVIVVTKQMREQALEYVRKNGSITNQECRELLHIGYDQAIRFFRELVLAGDLERVGKTSGVKYVLPMRDQPIKGSKEKPRRQRPLE